MFFVGIFSNIIPVIVLCVISLGFYINGNEISNISVNDYTFDVATSYEPKIVEYSNHIDTEIDWVIEVKNPEQPPIEYYNVGFYDDPIIDILTQQISINSYRGSPLFS